MLQKFCFKTSGLPFFVILLALGFTPANAGDAHFQYAEAFVVGVGAPVASGGTLTRTDDGISARLALTDLDKKAAYSVWWVIFNDPGGCSAPCNADDERSALYASGFVTGTDGTATVTAHLAAGDPPTGQEILLPGNPLLVDDGLLAGNGLDAEVHMVVRSHGEPIIGATGGQVATFNGSCDVNVCTDQLAIVFPAAH